jgi:hypothetical protein
MPRRAALALLLLLSLALAGCGLGAGESADGAATVTVTRDFGARGVGDGEQDPIPGGETVMRFLQRDFEVQTRYGGGFVQSINGIAGGDENGRSVDWFYFVNGILAEDGAAAHELQPGDRVWWDHRDWSATPDVHAVVGSWPEPFLSGEGGKKIPVRLDCADDAEAACDEVADRLEEAGVKVGGRAGVASAGGEGLLRVKVGVWTEVRKDPAVRELEKGPAASGVFARPAEDGRTIALLDPAGEPAGTLGPGGGLVAATRLSGEAPTWIVTGTDPAGVAAAAAQLQESALEGRFAIAVRDGVPSALPVQGDPVTP